MIQKFIDILFTVIAYLVATAEVALTVVVILIAIFGGEFHVKINWSSWTDFIKRFK
jgi:hypothetical protein